MIRLFFLYLFLVSASPLYAKEKKQIDLRQKLYEDMKVFERIFGDDTDFMQLDQEMMKAIQEHLRGTLSEEEINQLLNPRSFGNAFEQDESPRSDSQLEWSETEKARTLTIKIVMPKDQALDLKIEKGQIKISGEIKKGRGVQRFSRVLSVPSDCDATQAQISSDKQGRTLVTLPKLFPSKAKSKEEDGRKPVAPSGQGLNI